MVKTPDEEFEYDTDDDELDSVKEGAPDPVKEGAPVTEESPAKVEEEQEESKEPQP